MAQVKRCDQPSHPIDVALIGIRLTLDRFIRATKAHEIGRDRSIASGSQQWDHFAIEVRPRRLTVQQQDGFCVSWAVIDIVDTESVPLDILGSERIVWQMG